MKNLKLDGYSLTEKLKKARRSFPLTSTEQALYHELVSLCNDVDWQVVFTISNYQLCSSLMITEKTLITARNSLIKAGLIFYSSGKSRRAFSKYSFVKNISTTGKITVDTTVDRIADTTVDTTVDTTANASDYIQTKTETKLKDIEASALYSAWKKWKDYKQSEFRFKYKSIESECTAFEHLSKMSENNPEKAMALVENAIAKSWKGIYPIKEDQKQPPVVQLTDYQKKHKEALEKAKNYKSVGNEW